MKGSDDELVSQPKDGDDVTWLARMPLQLLPQDRDVNIDGPGGRHRIVAPHFVQELVARDRRPMVFDKIGQQRVLARRECDLGSTSGHFSPPVVHDDVAKLEDREVGLRDAAKQRLQPRQKLADLERLG